MATHQAQETCAAGNHSVSFRIYPRPRRSKIHFVVRVFPTKAEMTRAAKAYRRLLPRGFRAATVAQYRRDGRNRLSPQRGEVFFCWPHLDVGSIAHELLHVALAHARDIMLRLGAIQSTEDTRPEEAVAEMVDTLTSQTITACRKLKIPVGCDPTGGN